MALETLKTIEPVLEFCINELCPRNWGRPGCLQSVKLVPDARFELATY